MVIIPTKDHLRRFNIPETFWYAKLSEIPEICDHKKGIIKYLDNLSSYLNEGTGLILLGEYSTGKTAAACIILKAVAAIKRTGLFIMCGKIPDVVYNKELFDDSGTWYDRMISVDLLVIDELMLFKDQRDLQIEYIIRERSSRMKSTIITTNHNREYLKTHYQGLYNVLTECTIPIKFAGYNFRANLSRELEQDFLKK